MKHSVRVRQSTCKTIAYTITHTLCEMMDEVFIQGRFITHKPTAVRVLNELYRYSRYLINEDGVETWYATNQYTADIYNCGVRVPPITVRIPQFELVEVEVDFSFSEGVVIKGKS